MTGETINSRKDEQPDDDSMKKDVMAFDTTPEVIHFLSVVVVVAVDNDSVSDAAHVHSTLCRRKLRKAALCQIEKCLHYPAVSLGDCDQVIQRRGYSAASVMSVARVTRSTHKVTRSNG